ncbi:MAG: prepilin-type N-terminal cleavage/methylation domain-containing protein [bacterium]|nr:prepilin-type N-terminal cleavage/methylation domain-containing protein [bacterium]
MIATVQATSDKQHVTGNRKKVHVTRHNLLPFTIKAMPAGSLRREASRQGFTLIELLVVIAVVGVLAGAVVAAVNPAEQFARAHDANRKTKIDQLGKAIVARSIILGSYMPYGSSNWLTTLQATGEIKAVPAEITPRPDNVVCWSSVSLVQNNFCYYTIVYNGQPQAWVWTNVESDSLLNKCGVTVSTANAGPYYVYDTINNKTCLKCASDKGSETWVFSGACHAGE